MDNMTAFLEDVVAADAPERPVSDFLSDDVERAMQRIAARKPFMEGKFSHTGLREQAIQSWKASRTDAPADVLTCPERTGYVHAL